MLPIDRAVPSPPVADPKRRTLVQLGGSISYPLGRSLDVVDGDGSGLRTPQHPAHRRQFGADPLETDRQHDQRCHHCQRGGQAQPGHTW